MGSKDSPSVPVVIERFVKQLVITMKAVTLYPISSSVPRENADEIVKLLDQIFSKHANMNLVVSKKGLIFEGQVVFEGKSAFESFAKELYKRRIAEVRFHPGTASSDVLVFLEALKAMPSDLFAAGGVETRLWDGGVHSITVIEATTLIVESDMATESASEADSEEWPPAPSQVGEILEAASAGRPRDQRILVRILGDKQVISGYFTETTADRGIVPAEVARSLRIEQLAQAANGAKDSERTSNLRNLAEAIMELSAEVRYAALSHVLLPGVRTDDAIANLVRQMDVDELFRVLTEGSDRRAASAAGIARAIRNLAYLSQASREDILGSAGAAMLTAGYSPAETQAILEEAVPTRLKIADNGSQTNADSESLSILELLELTPKMTVGDFMDDSAVTSLQEEALAGITDGDVVFTMALIVASEVTGEGFSSMMSQLEDNLEVTIARGDYQVAADVASILGGLLADPEFPAERVARVRAAFNRLAGIKEMAAIAMAVRVYGDGTPEHDACLRLLDALGDSAIRPLLEALADEPDRAARKTLVDLIAARADFGLDSLGAHAGDSRWYFVRNVVHILGRTRRAEILGYLEKTLRHSDPRVRRETIRALFGVKTTAAEEMLVASLRDSDVSNVQLAARYLGMAHVVIAVPALKQVAAGEGMGNREMPARIEAIGALGAIGSKDAVPLLEELLGRRSLLGAARLRELKVAAEEALIAINNQDHQPGRDAQ